MLLINHKHTIFLSLPLLILLLFVLHFEATQGKILLPHTLQHNATNSSSSSPWLAAQLNNRRPPGCWRRPWICNQGQFPRVRRLCCRNRCVDITSDVNNCGMCGIRCRFTRQCCSGICIDTNRDPFNCGTCGNRCRIPSLCMYGMCGYAQPQPPFPFPPRRRRPFPPRPRPPRGRGRGGWPRPPPAG